MATAESKALKLWRYFHATTYKTSKHYLPNSTMMQLNTSGTEEWNFDAAFIRGRVDFQNVRAVLTTCFLSHPNARKKVFQAFSSEVNFLNRYRKLLQLYVCEAVYHFF